MLEMLSHPKTGGAEDKGSPELSEYSFVCGYAASGSAVVKFD